MCYASTDQLFLLQLTTQHGITAGLEADQAAKLAHIECLKRDATALRSALHEQQCLTQAAESGLDAAQAELSHHDLVIEGQLKSMQAVAAVMQAVTAVKPWLTCS